MSIQDKELEEAACKFTQKTRGCWLCIGTKDRTYGTFSLAGKQHRAHRISFNEFNGYIDSNLTVDHICRNRLFVNLKHLRQLTIKQNVLFGEGISAKNRTKIQCLRGHQFTSENTISIRRGLKISRNCRKCKNDRDTKARNK